MIIQSGNDTFSIELNLVSRIPGLAAEIASAS